MSRDHTKLKVFDLADAAAHWVYDATASLPPEERFGLQSQLRRAAVSVPTNLVEGCARKTPRDYLHFVQIALGSASEVRYLLSFARRRGFIESDDLERRYGDVVRALQGLSRSIETEL